MATPRKKLCHARPPPNQRSIFQFTSPVGPGTSAQPQISTRPIQRTPTPRPNAQQDSETTPNSAQPSTSSSRPSIQLSEPIHLAANDREDRHLQPQIATRPIQRTPTPRPNAQQDSETTPNSAQPSTSSSRPSIQLSEPIHLAANDREDRHLQPQIATRPIQRTPTPRPNAQQDSETTPNSAPPSAPDLIGNHPPSSTLPKQVLSNKTLTFQEHWFKQYTWLHVDNGKLLCIYCSTVNPIENFLPNVRKGEPAFICDGYSNWRHALDKFATHEKSDCHSVCIGVLVSSKTPSVKGQLNRQHFLEQQKSRRCLETIFTSLKYLGRQGLAIRGSNNDDGNFVNLLHTRKRENPEIESWLSRLDSSTPRQRHLLSADIQNEILQLYSFTILHHLKDQFKESKSFALICDGTQDCSGTEQEAVCVRYVDGNLTIREVFVGLYEMEGTTGLQISNMLQDVCLRLELPMKYLRGQSYDGASNMSGKYAGAQARLLEIQPLAHYFHCGAHVVGLVTQETIASNDWVRDTVSLVNDLGVLFSGTIKFRNEYDKITVLSDGPKKLRPLCPTRWALKYEGLSTVVTRYSAIIDSVTAFMNGKISTEQKAKGNGILSKLEQSSTRLGMACATQVLEDLYQLSKSLQGTAMTLDGCLKAVELCRDKLQMLRNDFQKIYEAAVTDAEKMELEPFTIPRKRRPPARYTGPAEAHQHQTPADFYRQKFFEVIDTARSGLKDRFPRHSGGIASYLKLLEAFNCTFNKDEIDNYPELNYGNLTSEMPLFKKHFKSTSPTAAAEALRSCQPEVRAMFPAVEGLVRLLLVRPTISCEAERSFSALRRLKTYLRNNMKATRLNSVSVMHVHQGILDNIDDQPLITEFTHRNDWRKSTFGK